MKKTKKRLLLVLTSLLVCNVMLLAQVKRIITGDVKDSKGLPISSATITIKGTSQSVATDQNGHYSINVEKNNAVLVFSSVGFTTKELNPQSSSTLDAALSESISDMNEVVVTALGVTKQKRELGYSVTNVKGSELAKTNEINPINALQGRVAGVQIDQGSGGLFGNTKIVIRGNSTLGTNNQPVFVIDGVIMDNDIFGGSGRDFGNDLKNLNMDDFETISVLKGSAAAALYGTRAINGVILITTKKGVQRKGLGLSVNQTFNVQQGYRGPDFQNVFGSGDTDAFNSDGWDNNYPNPYSTYRRFPVNPVTNSPSLLIPRSI
jgi:iron complex outermembrane receptor protein